MKDSEIFLGAAKRLGALRPRGSRFSCNAIREVVGEDELAGNKAAWRYADTFNEVEHRFELDMWGAIREKGEDPIQAGPYQKHLRVMTLCMAATIAKSEGR